MLAFWFSIDPDVFRIIVCDDLNSLRDKYDDMERMTILKSFDPTRVRNVLD